MARNRTITPDFWTWENVIDCKPMTRLLFIGLWNFADDGGVQPLKPRTIRLQVLPGDDGIDDAAVHAMLEELSAQGLVRLYSVEGQDYVAIVDWEQLQRVGKRARRRYPPFPSPRAIEEKVPSVDADEQLPAVEPPQSAPREDEPARWRAAIGTRLRQSWPHGTPIERMEPADGERWIVRWIEDGYDLERDVLPVVSALCALSPYRGPPTGLSELAASVEKNRTRRVAALSQADGLTQAAA